MKTKKKLKNIKYLIKVFFSEGRQQRTEKSNLKAKDNVGFVILFCRENHITIYNL